MASNSSRAVITASTGPDPGASHVAGGDHFTDFEAALPERLRELRA